MTSTSTIPYIGNKLSLITSSDLRYEGILYNINTADSTVGLTNVRCFGTEGRKMGVSEIAPNDRLFEYIVFKGKDIKDLTVSEPSPPDDPAIVAINPTPPQQNMPTTSSQGAGSVGVDPQMMHHHMGDPQNSRLGEHPGSFLVGQGVPPSSRMVNTGAMNHLYGGHRTGNMYTGMGGGRNFEYVGSFGPLGGRRGPGGQYLQHLGGPMYMSTGRRGGYGGHRGGRSGNYGNTRRIIGELDAQPNQTLQSLVEKAFNFEEANSKFDKSSIIQETKGTGGTTPITEGKDNGQTGTGGSSETTTSGGLPVVKSVYDKKSSFFDNISCETLDRQTGADVKLDRAKQRQLDVETFGQAATQARAGRTAGRMARRGRGGGMGGYRRPLNGQSSMMGPASHLGMSGYQHMSISGGYSYGQPRF